MGEVLAVAIGILLVILLGLVGTAVILLRRRRRETPAARYRREMQDIQLMKYAQGKPRQRQVGDMGTHFTNSS